MRAHLGLHEEILLLALKDREGTVLGCSTWPYALAGAVAAELLLRGRARTAPRGSSVQVEVVDAAPSGDPALDDALAALAERKGPPKLADWVGTLAAGAELRHRVAEGLCRRGILRADRASVLMIFSRRVYPEVDHGPEHELVTRIRRALSSGEPDPRTAALVGLAHAGDLLPAVLGRDAAREHRGRIEAIAASSPVAEVAVAAREAAEAAATAALLAATTATIAVT